jgi:hypothetical protein
LARPGFDTHIDTPIPQPDPGLRAETDAPVRVTDAYADAPVSESQAGADAYADAPVSKSQAGADAYADAPVFESQAGADAATDSRIPEAHASFEVDAHASLSEGYAGVEPYRNLSTVGIRGAATRRAQANAGTDGAFTVNPTIGIREACHALPGARPRRNADGNERVRKNALFIERARSCNRLE